MGNKDLRESGRYKNMIQN